MATTPSFGMLLAPYGKSVKSIKLLPNEADNIEDDDIENDIDDDDDDDDATFSFPVFHDANSTSTPNYTNHNVSDIITDDTPTNTATNTTKRQIEKERDRYFREQLEFQRKLSNVVLQQHLLSSQSPPSSSSSAAALSPSTIIGQLHPMKGSFRNLQPPLPQPQLPNHSSHYDPLYDPPPPQPYQPSRSRGGLGGASVSTYQDWGVKEESSSKSTKLPKRKSNQPRMEEDDETVYRPSPNRRKISTVASSTITATKPTTTTTTTTNYVSKPLRKMEDDEETMYRPSPRKSTTNPSTTKQQQKVNGNKPWMKENAYEKYQHQKKLMIHNEMMFTQKKNTTKKENNDSTTTSSSSLPNSPIPTTTTTTTNKSSSSSSDNINNHNKNGILVIIGGTSGTTGSLVIQHLAKQQQPQQQQQNDTHVSSSSTSTTPTTPTTPIPFISAFCQEFDVTLDDRTKECCTSGKIDWGNVQNSFELESILVDYSQLYISTIVVVCDTPTIRDELTKTLIEIIIQRKQLQLQLLKQQQLDRRQNRNRNQNQNVQEQLSTSTTTTPINDISIVIVSGLNRKGNLFGRLAEYRLVKASTTTSTIAQEFPNPFFQRYVEPYITSNDGYMSSTKYDVQIKGSLVLQSCLWWRSPIISTTKGINNNLNGLGRHKNDLGFDGIVGEKMVGNRNLANFNGNGSGDQQQKGSGFRPLYEKRQDSDVSSYIPTYTTTTTTTPLNQRSNSMTSTTSAYTTATSGAAPPLLLCEMGCGFFGNEHTGNCCSKCWTDLLQDDEEAPPISSSSSSSASSSASEKKDVKDEEDDDFDTYKYQGDDMSVMQGIYLDDASVVPDSMIPLAQRQQQHQQQQQQQQQPALKPAQQQQQQRQPPTVQPPPTNYYPDDGSVMSSMFVEDDANYVVSSRQAPQKQPPRMNDDESVMSMFVEDDANYVVPSRQAPQKQPPRMQYHPDLESVTSMFVEDDVNQVPARAMPPKPTPQPTPFVPFVPPSPLSQPQVQLPTQPQKQRAAVVVETAAGAKKKMKKKTPGNDEIRLSEPFFNDTKLPATPKMTLSVVFGTNHEETVTEAAGTKTTGGITTTTASKKRPSTRTSKKQGGSVLVLGASGRVGSLLIQQLTNHFTKPLIYGFCRHPSKLDDLTRSCCKNVYDGNARKVVDIEHALLQSRATMIVVCIGEGDKTSKTNLRTECAVALASVLQCRDTTNPIFKHVQVIVVSREKNKHGRFGRLTEYRLRHILRDHEEEKATYQRTELWDRTMIVQPCMVFTDPNDTKYSFHYNPTGGGGSDFVEYDNLDGLPMVSSQRSDFCEWLSDNIVAPCIQSGTEKTKNLFHRQTGALKLAMTRTSSMSIEEVESQQQQQQQQQKEQQQDATTTSDSVRTRSSYEEDGRSVQTEEEFQSLLQQTLLLSLVEE